MPGVGRDVGSCPVFTWSRASKGVNIQGVLPNQYSDHRMHIIDNLMHKFEASHAGIDVEYCFNLYLPSFML